MSSLSTEIIRLNVTSKSVKLTWPQAIRDMQSTYIVEGRAPRKSYIWETHVRGLLATSAVVKGLELDQYDYEFRIRTSNCSGLGEPTQPTSTNSLREKGEITTTAPSTRQTSRVSPLSANPTNWHTSNFTNNVYANSSSWYTSFHSTYHRPSHLLSACTPRDRSRSVPRLASLLAYTRSLDYSSTFGSAARRRQCFTRPAPNSQSFGID